MKTVKAILRPHAAWHCAIIGVRGGRVVYSMSKLIDARIRDRGDEWDAAYEYVEYNLYSDQKQLNVIIIDDTESDILDKTLDESVSEDS
jgi:hypothetical protein